jgi:hypothetical protein
MYNEKKLDNFKNLQDLEKELGNVYAMLKKLSDTMDSVSESLKEQYGAYAEDLSGSFEGMSGCLRTVQEFQRFTPNEFAELMKFESTVKEFMEAPSPVYEYPVDSDGFYKKNLEQIVKEQEKRNSRQK